MPSTSLVSALGNRMDHLIARQGITSGNIANTNTPGYLSRDVSFEKLAQKGTSGKVSLRTTDAQHLQGRGAQAGGKLTTDTTHLRHDGNSVKLDEEMLKLNQIQLDYGMVVQLYQKQKQLQQIAVRNNN